MPFEKQSMGDKQEKVQEIITDISTEELEKAIRWMSPNEREKLYSAVEIAKVSKESLV